MRPYIYIYTYPQKTWKAKNKTCKQISQPSHEERPREHWTDTHRKNLQVYLWYNGSTLIEWNNENEQLQLLTIWKNLTKSKMQKQVDPKNWMHYFIYLKFKLRKRSLMAGEVVAWEEDRRLEYSGKVLSRHVGISYTDVFAL